MSTKKINAGSKSINKKSKTNIVDSDNKIMRKKSNIKRSRVIKKINSGSKTMKKPDNAHKDTKVCIKCKQIRNKNEMVPGRIYCEECHNEAIKQDKIICNSCGELKKLDEIAKRRTFCRICKRSRDLESYHRNKENPAKKKKRKKWAKKYHQTYLKKPETIDRISVYRNTSTYKRHRLEWQRNYLATNIQARIASRMRTRIRECIKNRTDRSMDLLGCPMEQLIAWLEYNFNDNISWSNYGSYWHMDHLTPCASFDMTKKADQFVCFNWTNIVPCEANKNLSKGAKIDKKLIRYYDNRCNDFIDDFSS